MKDLSPYIVADCNLKATAEQIKRLLEPSLPFANLAVGINQVAPNVAYIIIHAGAAICSFNLYNTEERSSSWRLPLLAPTPYAIVNLVVRITSAVHNFVSTSRLVRLNNHECQRRNDWTFQAVRFVYHIYNGRIEMFLNPCNIAVVNGSVVGGNFYHLEQVDEASGLISQDDRFFTAWAERNHLFVALCNAHGVMEAHRDHILFEPTA